MERIPLGQPDRMLPSYVRFGPYELDLHNCELRKSNRRIRLQNQPFQVLIALLERPGDTVSREEIRGKLWPDSTVVEFDRSITVAVKRLRNALKESADKPRYIETIPRRGYRFICPVETVCKESAVLDASPCAETDPAPLPRQDLRPVDSLAAMRHHRTLLRPHRWSRVALSTAAVVFILLGGGEWYRRFYAPQRWVRAVAVPEVARFVDAGDDAAAFPLLYKGLQLSPKDPTLNRIRRQISHAVSIRTAPSSASVFIKPYADPDGPWLLIGQSPLRSFMLPMGYYRWKIAKPGFQTLEAAGGIQAATIDFMLDPPAIRPAAMVHVPGGLFAVFGLNPVHLDDYWIDTYEVTNRQFREFVRNGGYKNRQYWREDFVRDGRTLSWQHAMDEFRDATGQPGPSTWELGDYPPGRDEFPVDGVSWYEAAAFAEFAKKQLPTVYHWYRAAGQGIYSDILFFSNFDGKGPALVGSRRGLGPFGTYDMAGNVKEWCRNTTGNRRYILGGGWNEGRAYYVTPDALSPFDRSPANGFRCVKYGGSAASRALTGPVERPSPNYGYANPVSENVYRAYRSLYSYDHRELHARTEAVDNSDTKWQAERVTFDAAYGHQRLTAWLYLPKNGKPPYETIVYFPAGHSRVVRGIDNQEIGRFDFLMRTGRAVLFPIYQGTYDRRQSNPPNPSSDREQKIQQFQDLQRSLDYLQTRPDVAHGSLGFFGISGGAQTGVIILAQESRFRAAALAEVGISPERKRPEIDEINFAPHVRVPVLMLNGRYDFVFPLETSQLPLFRLLGTPPKDKRHVLFDSGHMGGRLQYEKETLDWFDRYLGPVASP